MAANPNFNQLDTNFSKPNPNTSGKQMAGQLGIQYDLDAIRQIFTDAANSKYGVTKKTYDDAIKAFYDLMSSNQALQQQALSKTEAASVVNNDSEGLAAANKLSAILGGSQQASAGAQDLALQQMRLGDQLGADVAQAEKDSLNQYNDIGAMLGQLINERNAVQAQAYAAELAAAQQQEALANGGGGGGGYSTKGGGTGTGTGTPAPETKPGDFGSTGTVIPENFKNDGRFTQSIIEQLARQSQTTKEELDTAIKLGRHLDFIDVYGYENPGYADGLKSVDPNLTYRTYASAIVDANTNWKPRTMTEPATRVSATPPTSPQAKFPDEKFYPSNITIPRDDWNTARNSQLANSYQSYNQLMQLDTKNKVTPSFIDMNFKKENLPKDWTEAQKNRALEAFGKNKMVNANGTVVTASKDNGMAERTAMLDFANANHDLYKATGGVANPNNASLLQAPQAAEKDTFDLGKALASMFQPIPKSSAPLPTAQPYDRNLGMSLDLNKMSGAPTPAPATPEAPVNTAMADLMEMFNTKDKNKNKVASKPIFPGLANLRPAAAAAATAPKPVVKPVAQAQGQNPLTRSPASNAFLTPNVTPVQYTPKSSSSSSSSSSYRPPSFSAPVAPKAPQATTGQLYNPQTGQVYDPKKNKGKDTAGIGKLDKYGNTMF